MLRRVIVWRKWNYLWRFGEPEITFGDFWESIWEGMWWLRAVGEAHLLGEKVISMRHPTVLLQSRRSDYSRGNRGCLKLTCSCAGLGEWWPSPPPVRSGGAASWLLPLCIQYLALCISQCACAATKLATMDLRCAGAVAVALGAIYPCEVTVCEWSDWLASRAVGGRYRRKWIFAPVSGARANPISLEERSDCDSPLRWAPSLGGTTVGLLVDFGFLQCCNELSDCLYVWYWWRHGVDALLKAARAHLSGVWARPLFVEFLVLCVSLAWIICLVHCPMW